MGDEVKREEDGTCEYRLSFLLKDEDASPIRSALGADGVRIVSERPLTKVKLAYPVKKQQFAFAGTFVFRAPMGVLEGVLSNLKLAPDVLRLLTVKEFETADDGREAAFGEVRGKMMRRREREPRSFRTELSNEALEKKIEEILQ